MKDRRVKDMASAAQRFRRRVIAMLEARADALWTLGEPTAESRAQHHATQRILRIIRDMR